MYGQIYNYTCDFVSKAAIEFGPNVKDTLAITSEGTSHTYEHLLRTP